MLQAEFVIDRDQVLKNYYEHPQSWQKAFDVAQSYTTISDLPKAIYWYQESLRLDCNKEQKYIAHYCLAKTIETLAAHDHDYTWESALTHYLAAHAADGGRAEPLIKIASHYINQDNHTLAFLFAKRAVQLPYPDKALLIEKHLYDFTRYDILGRSAWYVGQYDIGHEALRVLLQKYPRNLQVANNLVFYVDRGFAKGRWRVQSLDVGGDTRQKEQKIWSILICTITERAQQFEQLTSILKKQIQEHHLENKIEVLFFCDVAGQCPIGYKRNKLLQASSGKYTCFVDDDDMLHVDYIKLIYDKLQTDVDCVSLMGIRTKDGKDPEPFIHSIEYDSYFARDGIWRRPPNHLNPIKRTKAITCAFPVVNWGEDTDWAMALSRSGCLKTQEKIEVPYYFYNYTTKA